MIEQYVPSASTFSPDIDHIIWLVLAITGFWFLLAEGVFFWLIFRYRARPGVKAEVITGEKPHEKRWVTWPHYLTLIFDLWILVVAIKVWTAVKITMPPAEETVRIIAQQWAWTFVHAGPDNKLDTADDITVVDELHVQKDRVYHFELTSRDVLHSFSVAVFRLKQDAIPGRVIKGWFKPTLTGQFDIQCTEICGIGHGVMPARIFIESPEDHARWLKVPANVATAVPPSAPAAPAIPGGTK